MADRIVELEHALAARDAGAVTGDPELLEASRSLITAMVHERAERFVALYEVVRARFGAGVRTRLKDPVQYTIKTDELRYGSDITHKASVPELRLSAYGETEQEAIANLNELVRAEVSHRAQRERCVNYDGVI
jgi:hypothetical protein